MSDFMKIPNFLRWTPLQPAVFIDEITYYEQLLVIKNKVNEIIEKINQGDLIAKELNPGAEIGIDGGMLGDGVNFTGAENIDIDTFLMNSVYVSSKVGNHLIFKTKDITPDFKTSLTFLWQELPVNASCGKDNLGWGILRLNAVYKETDADIDYNSYNIEVLDFAFESERNVYNRRKDIRDRFKLTRRINPCDNSKNTMELYYTVPEVLPETECNSPVGPTCLFTLISADTNPHIEFDTQIILMNDGLNDTTYDIGTSGITINPVINYPFDSIELTGDTIGKKDPIDNRDIVINTETPQLIDSITVQGKAESQKVEIPKVYAPDKNDIVLEIDTLNITPEDLPIATKESLGVVQIGEGLDITPEGLLSVAGGGSGYTLPIASDTVLGGVKIPADGNIKIDDEGNITTDGSSYTLPVATTEALGGIKVGANLSITPDGVLSATGGTGGEGIPFIPTTETGRIYIDFVNGVDAETSDGSELKPFKTIDYALNKRLYKNIDLYLKDVPGGLNPFIIINGDGYESIHIKEFAPGYDFDIYNTNLYLTENYSNDNISLRKVINSNIDLGTYPKLEIDLIYVENCNIFYSGTSLKVLDIENIKNSSIDGYFNYKGGRIENSNIICTYLNSIKINGTYFLSCLINISSYFNFIGNSNDFKNCTISKFKVYKSSSGSFSINDCNIGVASGRPIEKGRITDSSCNFYRENFEQNMDVFYEIINDLFKSVTNSIINGIVFKTLTDKNIYGAATTNNIGMVKPDGTTITINETGTLTATGLTTLPIASDTVLGAVKVPSDSEVKIDGEGNLTLAKTIPDPYTLPVATDSILGGVKVSEGSGLSITSDGQLSSLGQYADINLIPVNEEVITYYVDFTNGSDLNVGTQQSPLKSIEAAINKHTTKNIIIILSGSNTKGMILLDAFGYDSIQITSGFNVSVNELVCQNGSITINSGFTTSNLIIRNADLTLGGGTDFNITNSLTVMNSIFRYSNITKEITIPEMSVYNSLIYRNKSMKVSKGFRAYDSQFLTSDSSYTFKITTASGGYLAIENCIFDRGYVDNRALSQITIRNITLNKGSAGGHYFNNVIIQNVSSGGEPDPDQSTSQGSTLYLTNCKINGGHLVLSDLYFAGVCKIGSCQVYNRLNPVISDTNTTGSDTLLFVNCNCIFNTSMNKNSDKVSFETCVILDSGSNISNYPNTGCAILTT